MSATTTAFVEQVRARRAAAGQPATLNDDAVYRILDGLLGRGTVPTAAGTAQALTRSTPTTADTAGSRDE